MITHWMTRKFKPNEINPNSQHMIMQMQLQNKHLGCDVLKETRKNIFQSPDMFNIKLGKPALR